VACEFQLLLTSGSHRQIALGQAELRSLSPHHQITIVRILQLVTHLKLQRGAEAQMTAALHCDPPLDCEVGKSDFGLQPQSLHLRFLRGPYCHHFAASLL
jgi:hypothetical protein